jgi:hypothetical protein
VAALNFVDSWVLPLFDAKGSERLVAVNLVGFDTVLTSVVVFRCVDVGGDVCGKYELLKVSAEGSRVATYRRIWYLFLGKINSGRNSLT